ncbi:MAG: HlyD family efflux transporter periplasmic adaptor subunit [Planctomycetota bacterium]|nr:HlyD family efflux transporter periplasmic adaptor subunit [Planctomycetota bacterium]
MTSRRAPRGAATTTVVIAVIVVIAAVTGVMLLRGGGSGHNGNGDPDSFIVQSGSFDITIPASGELAALKQTEISSQLESRATITYIIEEGVWVEPGDVLIRLNDEEMVERIKDQEDAVNTAENAWVTARSNLEIQRQTNASEIEEADLNVRLAELALKAWEEGEHVSARQSLELELKTADKDYKRLVERFEASKDLLEQEFISEDEFKRDEISMIQARSRWEQAKLAIKVYDEYQFERDKAQLESDLKQARDRRARLEKRHATDIERLETEVASRAYHLESRKERLAKYKRQQALCTIRAPQAGLVVYATSLDVNRRGRGESPPDVGTEISPKRPVIVLPDTSKMIAEVKVNEALSGKIRSGQRAIVISDALPDTAVEGEVLDVGVLAESGGWRDPTRRDYTVRVLLSDGADLGLKPSMRCKTDIFVGRVDDAVFVPIQAIFRDGPVAFVYVPEGSGYAQKRVELGRSSELFIEITDGLAEGDVVLLREPSADRIRSRIPIEETSRNGWMNGQTPPGPPQGRAGDATDGKAERSQRSSGERPRRPQGQRPARGNGDDGGADGDEPSPSAGQDGETAATPRKRGDNGS